MSCDVRSSAAGHALHPLQTTAPHRRATPSPHLRGEEGRGACPHAPRSGGIAPTAATRRTISGTTAPLRPALRPLQATAPHRHATPSPRLRGEEGRGAFPHALRSVRAPR